MKYGLLIQGPLLSVGRTGATGHRTLADDAVVRFDCRQTILNNISEYGDLFSEIVLCTWDDGIYPDFEITNGKFCRIPDKAKKIIDARVKRNWINNDIVNNMCKQYYGTYNGLLQFNNVDYVVKIRTDQSLDLELLVKSIVDYNRLYITYIIRGYNVLPDFYFAARLDTMIDLFKILSENEPIVKSPHQDIILRYALARYFKEIDVDIGWYNKFQTLQQNKIFAYMFNNVFYPLPRKVYESIIWRGEPFCEEYRQNLDELCFSNPDIYTQKYSLVGNGIENAFFRTRDNFLADNIQKTLFFMVRLIAYIFNHAFK